MKEPDGMAFLWKVATIAFVLSVVFYRASYTIADPDLWGHVRFGQDVLRSASIPSEDPYSYLSDREWINHEWLSEVVFALAYDHAGAAGLVCLKVAITLALFGLLYWHFCAHGLGVLRGGMLLLVVLLPTLVGLTTVRPHLFTYLGFGLIVMAIHATEHGRRRLLWAASPLLALWANLHGGFVAGVGVLFLWLVLRLLAALWETRSLSRLVSPVRLQTAGAVAVACLATLLNPNGIDLLTFLGRTAAAPRPHKAALTGILAFTALLPLQAVRHLPLFAIACGVLTAEHLADAVERSWPRDEPARGGRLRIGFTGLAFAGTLILILASIPNFACIRIDPKPGFRMPARAVALMKESQVRGNLAVFFDWGEYVIWHLAPNVRVSVDGRRETIYSPAALVENLAFLWGTGDWDALLDERPTDLVLMDKAQPCYNLMQLKPGWSLAHADSLGALFVRRSSPLQEALRQTVVPDLPSDGRGLCFP
jgi:hypothetical protein